MATVVSSGFSNALTSISTVGSTTLKLGNDFQVARLRNGNIVAITHDSQAYSSSNIYARIFSGSTLAALTSDVQVNSVASGSKMYPADFSWASSNVVVSAIGPDHFIVVWSGPQTYGGTTKNDRIYAQVLTNNGVLVGDTFSVYTYPTAFETEPELVVTGTNSFSVMWRDSPGFYKTDFTFDGVSTPTNHGVVALASTTGYNNLRDTDSVFSSDGTKIWLTGTATSTTTTPAYFKVIAYAVSTTGKLLVSPIVVSNNASTADQHAPVVTELKNGQLAFSWYGLRTDGSGEYDLYARVLNADGSYATDVQTIAKNISTANPVIEAYKDGFVVGWIDKKVGTSSYLAAYRFFDSTCTPDSQVYRIDQGTATVGLESLLINESGQISLFTNQYTPLTGSSIVINKATVNLDTSIELDLIQAGKTFSIDASYVGASAYKPSYQSSVTWEGASTSILTPTQGYTATKADIGTAISASVRVGSSSQTIKVEAPTLVTVDMVGVGLMGFEQTIDNTTLQFGYGFSSLNLNSAKKTVLGQSTTTGQLQLAYVGADGTTSFETIAGLNSDKRYFRDVAPDGLGGYLVAYTKAGELYVQRVSSTFGLIGNEILYSDYGAGSAAYFVGGSDGTKPTYLIWSATTTTPNVTTMFRFRAVPTTLLSPTSAPTNIISVDGNVDASNYIRLVGQTEQYLMWTDGSTVSYQKLSDGVTKSGSITTLPDVSPGQMGSIAQLANGYFVAANKKNGFAIYSKDLTRVLYQTTDSNSNYAPASIQALNDGSFAVLNYLGELKKYTAAGELISTSSLNIKPTYGVADSDVIQAADGSVYIFYRDNSNSLSYWGRADQNFTYTGTAKEYETINVSLGGIHTEYVAVDWYRNGVLFASNSGTSYTLTKSDIGKSITVKARPFAGSTEILGEYLLTQSVANTNDLPTGLLHASGNLIEGQELLLDSTQIQDLDGIGAFTYSWYRDGTLINTTNANKYTLTQSDVGKIMSATVNYTDMYGTAEQVGTSFNTAVINTSFLTTGNVTIEGLAVVYQTLTANVSGIGDQDGIQSISYQWKKNGVSISGETSATYRLRPSDTDALIEVITTIVDGEGVSTIKTASFNETIKRYDGTPLLNVTITDNVNGVLKTAGSAITYTLNFDKAVTGLDISDFSVAGGTLSNFTKISSTNYTVKVTPQSNYAGSIKLGLKSEAVTFDTGLLNQSVDAAAQYVFTKTADNNYPSTINVPWNSLAPGGAILLYPVFYGNTHYYYLDVTGSASSSSADYVYGNSLVLNYTVGNYTLSLPTTTELNSLFVNDYRGIPFSNTGTGWAGNGNRYWTSNTGGFNGRYYVTSTGTTGLADSQSAWTGFVAYKVTANTTVAAFSDNYILNEKQTPSSDLIFMRTGATTQDLYAELSFYGTATIDSDVFLTGNFTKVDGRYYVKFLAGQETATININAINDQVIEGVESFNISVLPGNDYLAVSNDALQFSIQEPVFNGSIQLAGSFTQGQSIRLINNLSELAAPDFHVAITRIRWFLNGIEVSDSESLTLDQSSVGKSAYALVDVVDSLGITYTFKTSNSLSIQNLNDLPVGNVLVASSTNIPMVDSLLTATPDISDIDGLGTMSYCWLADGATISGATSSTYKVTSHDIGKRISARVTYIDGQGSTETVTSSDGFYIPSNIASTFNTQDALFVSTVTANRSTEHHAFYVDKASGNSIEISNEAFEIVYKSNGLPYNITFNPGSNSEDTLGDTNAYNDLWLAGGAGSDRLYGGKGNDYLIGGAGNDYLFGTAASAGSTKSVDRFNGGSGNDDITSGSRADVAEYNGCFKDYNVTFTGSSLVVSDNRAIENEDGEDTLHAINILKFTDAMMFIPDAAEKISLNGSEPNHIFSVIESKLVSGTAYAEKFIIAQNVSSMILAGDGDVVELPGKFSDYIYTELGSSLQMTLGNFMTTINIGGHVILKTAVGSINAVLDFANLTPQLKIANQTVTDPSFDPTALDSFAVL